MIVWGVSLACLMLTTGFFLGVLVRSQNNSLRALTELQESQSRQTSELLNRLVTLLGTKDPLAYQAVVLASQPQPESDETILYSDEAEAQRYQEALDAGGFAGYGYPE